MKKIYFIVDLKGPIYYKEVSDDWSSNALRVGYNDSYEMRSTYVHKPDLSENFEDIKTRLDKSNKIRIKKLYKQLAEALSEKYKEEDCVKYDERYTP